MMNQTMEAILNMAGYPSAFLDTIPGHIKCINDLTAAEIKFFFDCRSGHVNLSTPLSSRVINGSLKHKIIRSELLEWTLIPEMSNTFFPQAKLVLIDAIIDRYPEVLKNFEQSYVNRVPAPKEKIRRKNTQSYSLDLSFSKVTVDLIFIDCKIRGGINFEGSVAKSLVFNRTVIGYTENLLHGEYQSFNGINLKVDGDFKINYVIDAHEKMDDKKANIMARKSNKRVNQVNGTIRLDHTHISRQLNFDGLVLGEWASINSYYLQTNSLFMDSVNSESYIDLTFAKVEELFNLTNSRIFGSSEAGYSIEASGLKANDIFIRDSVWLKYGICLYAGDIKAIDFSGVFICPNKQNDISIDLRGAVVREDLIFSPRRIEREAIENNFSTILGKTLLDNANIRDIKFSRVRFIYKLNEITLSANDLTINGKITFSQNMHLPPFKCKDFEGSKINELYLKVKGKRKVDNTTHTAGQETREDAFFNKSSLLDTDFIAYSDYYTYLFLPDMLVNLRPIDLPSSDNQDRNIVYVKESYQEKNTKKTETSTAPSELLWINEFKRSYECLYDEITDDIKRENWSVKIQGISDLIVETAIVVGEASFSGLICKEQFDCASTFFYGMDPGKLESHRDLENGNFRNANALSIKYATIEGQLFLNEGAGRNLPFRAYGQVNLHSSKVDQFFVSPKRGMNKYVQWKIVGMKYEYIYSNEKGKVSNLENCKWFHDYHDENNRQPYEQLALAYLKAGDDAKARRVLTRTVARDLGDKLLMALLKFFVWSGTPPYKALLAFLFLGILGWGVFSWSGKNGGIAAINEYATLKKGALNNQVEFNSLSYSFQQIIPIISLDQKNMFAPNYGSRELLEFRYPLSNNKITYLDTGKLTAVYQIFHTFLGTIYLGMFIIGITRIIRSH